jgi:pimeloyl-ACP methyl ester carboxylesterase
MFVQSLNGTEASLATLRAEGDGMLFRLTLVGSLALGASITAASHTVALTPFVFTTDDGHSIAAERGTVSVPENRTSDSSRRIDLEVIRFKSTSAVPGNPIVYLAGGPGVSGISTARGRRWSLFQDLRSLADVIVWDQRGTGRAAASLVCPDTAGYPLDRPGDRAELVRLYVEKSKACAAYFRARGVDVAGYNTNESADDLDAVRQAIGADRMTLLGTSYGTTLAMAAIRRHERHIDKAALFGVERVDAAMKLPSAVQASLESIDALVQRDQDLSRRIPSLIDLVRRVLDSLERQPLEVSVPGTHGGPVRTVVIGRFDVQWATSTFLMGSPAVFTLPAVYEALAARNASHPEVQRMATAVIAQRTGSIGAVMPLMMDCFSGVSGPRYAQILREEPQSVLGRLIDFPFPEICDGWGRPDLGDTFRTVTGSRIPLMLVSGTLDARTPPPATEELRRAYPKAVHLVVEGATHGDALFFASPEILVRLRSFLAGEPLESARIAAPVPSLSK